MLKIEKNTIIFNRGDDIDLIVNIENDDGEQYEIQPSDTLTLTVRERPEESSPILLQATNTPRTNHIALSHDLTSQIEVGLYSCDIQLTDSEGKITTVFPNIDDIPKGSTKSYKNFDVRSEVTICEPVLPQPEA